ncbi:MAG: hypothetical protein ABSG77_00450 [Candidatus Acidiferrum sp.]
MFSRRTLLQLVTKLAIGVGALFLVGVLLAAIPNHRAPVVNGTSPQAGQETQGTNSAIAPETKVDETKSQEKESVQGVAHGQATTAKSIASTR